MGIASVLHRPLHGGYSTQVPEKIIIHSMAEYIVDGNEILHAYDLLKKYDLSAHVLVLPSGVLMRCRDDDQGAWHAKGHNKNSLGIEFLVPGIFDYESFLKRIEVPYLTDLQIKHGFAQVYRWCRKHAMIKDLKRHSDVDPERKKDPGDGFPWSELLQHVKEVYNGSHN